MICSISPETMCVTELVTDEVVSTTPKNSLKGAVDHGTVTNDTITRGYAEGGRVLRQLDAVGVTYHVVVAQLEPEGIDLFVNSWNELLAATEDALNTAIF